MTPTPPQPRYRATIPFMGSGMTWQNQAPQYAVPMSEIEPGGITYFRGDLDPSAGDDRWVDCLLAWDPLGELVGILNHYPMDLPPWEKKGNITVFVHPGHLREGIATRLFDEAVARWKVRLDRQVFTPVGAMWANSLVARGER